jgi:hypothetical protein
MHPESARLTFREMTVPALQGRGYATEAAALDQ